MAGKDNLGGVRTSPIAPIAVFGFATAVAMWCLWLITHHPAIALPAAVNGPLLLACLLAGTIWAGRACGTGSAWLVGLGTGLTASAINLLILNMFIVEPPTPQGEPAPGLEGLTPSGAIAIAGFLALGAVTGLAGGWIGSLLGHSAPADARRWLARFAIVASVATFALLLVGATVTSTSSGMAIPGWPDSRGANMFLFPIALMGHPRVFLEHSHRLFGAMVGLTTIALAVFTLTVETRRWVRWWAVACLALVCIQGYFGGASVLKDSPSLRAVHGVTAQLFFALVVALAAYLSPLYRTHEPVRGDPGDRKRKAFSAALLHSTILQLILGALYRHVGQVKGNLHALFAHAGFAIVVVIVAVMAGFALRARGAPGEMNTALRRLGTGILAVVALQFVLGWAAFFLVLKAGPRGAPPQADQLAAAKEVDPLTAAIATIHQGNGALLLALGALAVVFTRQVLRLAKPPAAGAAPPG